MEAMESDGRQGPEIGLRGPLEIALVEDLPGGFGGREAVDGLDLADARVDFIGMGADGCECERAKERDGEDVFCIHFVLCCVRGLA